MRIHEVLTESKNLEEGPLGQKIQRGLSKAGNVVGQIAAVPQGVGRAIKKGYKQGVNAIGGADLGQPDSGVAPAGTAGGTEEPIEPTMNPMQQSSDPTVRQINKIIPKLKTRDVQSVKKNVDATLQKRMSKKMPANKLAGAKVVNKKAA